MNGLLIGVYGIYLILVGINGNAGKLASNVQADAPKFLPWIIGILVLSFLYTSSETGRKVTGPFLALLVLSFVLKRFDTLKSQTVALWNMAASSTSSSSAPPAPAPAGSVTPPPPLPDSTTSGAPSPNSAGFSTVSNPSSFSDALASLENAFS